MALIGHPDFTNIELWLTAAIVLLVFHLLRTALSPGLRSLPGPFLAKFTDGWRLLKVWRGDYHKTTIELHRKYGDLVRIGPNAVSIADPAAVESIYGLKANFPKNIRWHSAIKRPVSSAYSMSTVTDYEPHVDEIIKRLVERLKALYCTDSDQKILCRIDEWIHYFSFDVIAEMTWSGALGFLDQGKDVGGLIKALENDMDYFAPVSQMPWLDNFMRKNPVARYITKKSSNSAKFGADRVRERRAKSKLSPSEQADFLSKFLGAAAKDPELVSDQAIVSYMVTNLVAGSDTTAISIRAVLYYLLKNPDAYKRLQEEFDRADLPEGPVSWADAQKLPYLSACIKEAFRLHPAVGVPLERLAPPGFELPNGQKVPAGTIVGISAWPVHRNPNVFGNNVDQYYPERWLQQPGEDDQTCEQRVKRMKRADMTFGYGSRTCLGKNIGMMETYKTIPTLLRAFDICLVDPKKEWKLKNSWFVRQSGLDVYLKIRP